MNRKSPKSNIGHVGETERHVSIYLPCDLGGAKEPGMMYFPTK